MLIITSLSYSHHIPNITFPNYLRSNKYPLNIILYITQRASNLSNYIFHRPNSLF